MEMIAMLDGLGDFAREAVSGSQGGNYSGGSSWAPGLPTYPSSNGLAGSRGLADIIHDAVSGSRGGNYSGGSSWAPGLPTYPSSNGLAEYMAGMAPEERKMMRTVISPGSGELYQGGSSWASGLPLYPSSNGLAATPRREWRTYLRAKSTDIARGTKLQRLSRTMGRIWTHASQFCYQPPVAHPAPAIRVVSDVRQLEAAIVAYKAHVLSMAALFGRYINSCSSIPPATVRNMRQAMRLAAQA